MSSSSLSIGDRLALGLRRVKQGSREMCAGLDTGAMAELLSVCLSNGLLCSCVVCVALLCPAVLRSALICSNLLCCALLWSALLRFGLLCSALL
jgi:hypothetical protein